jgi:beta-glucanase (GH16 family)
LFKNIRKGLIDPDTPASAMSRTDSNGNKQTLAFSDEFNEAGRTFYDGDDPFFQAMDFWYGVTVRKHPCCITVIQSHPQHANSNTDGLVFRI